MLTIFRPTINALHTFPHHVLIWIKSGRGLIEVDFQLFSEFEDRLIFLAPNQTVKFIFGDFEVAMLEFPDQIVQKSPDHRVLFKHLVSLGYVEFSEDRQSFTSLFQESPARILDISTHRWFWQNPFRANKEEYTIIFDLKDLIDQHFKENWSVKQFISTIDQDYYSIYKLVKNRLGLTVKNLAQRKIVLESQKGIALTDKPIQEVAHDMGFNDPAYFNRFFKKHTQCTPLEFRDHFGDPTVDTFIQDFLALLHQHHKANRAVSFYADRMHMSIKTLSRKVKNKFNMPVGDLIRLETISTAKKLLKDLSVKEIAFELGFQEANHFSAFFKKYTGQTPTEHQSKKYNL